MASPHEKPQQPDAAESPRAFEDSLAELQQIVGELEEGTLGLEESLRRFEQGITLLRHCYRVLEQAEQKIEILTGQDGEGNPTTAPFDASATFAQPGTSGHRNDAAKAAQEDEPDEAPEEDSDRRLF